MKLSTAKRHCVVHAVPFVLDENIRLLYTQIKRKGKSNMSKEERERELNKRYPVICPFCHEQVYAKKSLGHIMGLYAAGSGICIKCKNHMHLTYIPETNSMVTEQWDEYIKRKNI